MVDFFSISNTIVFLAYVNYNIYNTKNQLNRLKIY